ncbi:MAG TPA: hypothetical protein PK230_08950 [Chitinophagales bacterium]|nr:hypothetical protein [Chitinophagales bacterium]
MGTSIHDRPYYYNIFLTEHLKNVWNSRQAQPQNLQDQYLHLERLYAFNKIQMILIELNRSKTFNIPYELGVHQSFLDNLVANNYWKDTILEFNYYQIQLIHQPDVALYHLLKTSLRQEMSRLHPSEVRNARVILANFCLQQIRLNNPDFYGDYLEILLEQIAQEQKIIIMELKNIVTVALRMKDLEWVSAFLENHKHLITPVELAEHAYQYNLARVYFLQGKYEAALELLLFVKTDNIYYDVEAKILVIKILYEQINSGTLSGKKLFNKEEELELKTEGFKSYLLMTKKLDTVPTVTVEAWKGFSKFSRRIVPILLTATYNKAVKVKNDLVVAFSEGSKIVEYPWLLQKVDELVQKSTNKTSAKSKK